MNVIIYILAWVIISLIVAALWNTLFDDDNDPEP